MRKLIGMTQRILLLLVVMNMFAVEAWAEEQSVTFKATGKADGKIEYEVIGEIPDGSSAIWETTGGYESYEDAHLGVTLKGTNGEKYMSITWTGYDDMIIRGLSIYLGTNKNAGNGGLKFMAGETELAYIALQDINKSDWLGRYPGSDNFATKEVTLTKYDYVMNECEELTLTINNTANSLYIASVTLTYESTKTDDGPTTSVGAVARSNNGRKTMSTSGALLIENADCTYYLNGVKASVR